ncbi:MAG: lipocalin family protein [Chitinophagales bacterium]
MKKLPILLLVLVVIVSCKKNSCTTSVASISGAYKFSAYTYKANASAPEQDYFNIILSDPCERDDIITLNSSGTYDYKDAGVVCAPSGDSNGTWSLSGASITIDGTIATIQSFDCKSLIILNSDVMTAGDQLKITLTKQ